MEINLLFFIAVVPAIILFGIAKSGLGGSIALISIPLMTIAMPLTEALGIILPILIFSDFIATYKYRKEFDLGTLKLIVPFAALGIVIGSFTFSYFSEDLLKFIIGLMGFLFAGHYFLFKKNISSLILTVSTPMSASFFNSFFSIKNLFRWLSSCHTAIIASFRSSLVLF